jgi:hypothetical protein
MSVLQTLAVRIGTRRWEAASGLLLAGLLVAVGYCFVPWSWRQIATIKTLRSELRSIRNIDSLGTAIAASHGAAAAIDTSLQAIHARRSFDEAQVVAGVYAMADSAGCGAAKVLINEPLTLANVKEIPILFDGSGAYAAIGRFVARIENMEYATRIRQITLKNGSNGQGTVVVDFIIMDSSR